MTGEKSYSEIFVSGHPEQEKEEKGAPLSLNKEPGIGCSFTQKFKIPYEDPNGKNPV